MDSGRAAGDEEAHPAARLGDDLGEDEPVGQGPPEREARGDRGAGDPEGAVRPAHADRPEEDLPLEPGARQDVVHDLGIDLLEDARDADHDVGPDLEEVLADRLDALGVGDRAPLVDVGERDHPLEDVGQGEEGQDGVLVGKDDDLGDADDVAQEVAVGQDDALGDAGRPRRVDEGRLVLRPDLEGFPLEEARVGGVRLPAHLASPPPSSGRPPGLRGGT